MRSSNLFTNLKSQGIKVSPCRLQMLQELPFAGAHAYTRYEASVAAVILTSQEVNKLQALTDLGNVCQLLSELVCLA